MSWQHQKTLAWQEPLAFAERFADEDMALLYSGLRESFTGGMSYLFLHPVDVVSGEQWASLPPLHVDGSDLPLWVGYLGYGMREEAARGTASYITLPDFRLIRYAQLYRFDHTTQQIDLYQQASARIPPTQPRAAARHTAQIQHLASNLSRAQYASMVNDTIAQIRDGHFYQANITRKFYGDFTSAPDSFSLFNTLCSASPAPYSAYIRHGETAILSSSPECFLTIDAAGRMTTRPIKGSARRAEDAVRDQHIRDALRSSAKNHAENLMIVDLMRNDLARVSTPQSVTVAEQSALYSYQTIHHLISTIHAQKLPHFTAYDSVRACFPAGSMTGAPKIAAMRWCTQQEKIERGVYSGAIGWFGSKDTCDLSVVIRTLIIDGKHFEFQVGGGIVADSTAEDEWQETIAKARGIIAALGITEDAIAAL